MLFIDADDDSVQPADINLQLRAFFINFGHFLAEAFEFVLQRFKIKKEEVDLPFGPITVPLKFGNISDHCLDILLVCAYPQL